MATATVALDWATLVRVVGDLEDALDLVPSPVVTDPPATLERLIDKVRDLHREHDAVEWALDSDDAFSLRLEGTTTGDRVGDLVRKAYDWRGGQDDTDELRRVLRKVGEELGRLEGEVDDALR